MNRKPVTRLARVALAAVMMATALSLAPEAVQPVEASPNYSDIKCGGPSVGGHITSIGSSGYYDNWYFNGKAGDRVTITMTRTSGNLDSMVRLWFYVPGPGDQLLESAGTAGGNSSAVISNYTLPKTGRYRINPRRINGQYGTTTGNYKLTLKCSSSSSGTSMSNIGCGTTVTGGSFDGDYYDYWYFSGKAGDKVTITMIRTSGNLDSMVRLWFSKPGNDDFDWLTSDGSAGGSSDAFISNFTLPKTGIYTINPRRVNGNKGTTNGNYKLTLACSSGRSSRSSSNSCPQYGGGASWEGEIGAYTNDEVDTLYGDWWVFRAEDGDRVHLELKTLGFSPSLQLYRYEEFGLEKIADGHSTVTILPSVLLSEKLDKPGCYYVWVKTSSNAHYTLEFSIE